jgi:ligand-binding sensor domain-containing protein
MMKNYILQIQLIAIIICCNACNGQVIKNVKQPLKIIQNSKAGNFEKVRKTQNAFTDASFGNSVLDKDGNIWLCSNGEGVYKFNPKNETLNGGKPFTNYTTDDGLDCNIVYCALQDKQGNIWVGTKTGLNLYNSASEINASIKAFTPISIITNNKIDNPAYQNGVWSMMEDSKGTVWFGTDDGVYCYNANTQGFNSIKIFSKFMSDRSIINKDSVQLKAIFTMLEDKENNIWFGACNIDGICVYNPNVVNGKISKTLTQISNKNFQRVDEIIQDKNGNIFFAGVFSGICKYEIDTKNAKKGTIIKDVFKAKKGESGSYGVLEDKLGNIWFDQDGWLEYWDGKTVHTLTTSEGLPSKYMFPLLLDNKGNIWFSGPQMGLYKYTNGKFIKYSN